MAAPLSRWWRSLACALAAACGCSADPAPAVDCGADGTADGTRDAFVERLRDASDAADADARGDVGADLRGDVMAVACPAGAWCSALFPPDWTPEMAPDSAGRFLHDFSYAGYHNGEEPPPGTPPGPTFDVVQAFGADPGGDEDATPAIQAAIDAAVAAGGGVVAIPAGTFRCDGTLVVAGAGVVLRGAGAASTALHFTAPLSGAAHLTFHGALSRGPDLPLVVDGESRSREVLVADAATLSVGDDVSVGWIVSEAFHADHQMVGTWNPDFLGQWKAFFRRQVVAIDTSASPHVVTLDVPLRYAAKTRDQASLRRESGYLRECGLERLSLANAVDWSDAWAQTRSHLIELREVADCWVREVHSTASPFASGWSVVDTRDYHLQSGGVYVLDSKRVTVARSTMQSPQHRGNGGNGYLFEVSRSNEVLLSECEARYGRHNFIQNWDFGTSGCVFHRCHSSGSAFVTPILGVPVATPARSEYHHSLAMATLVDQCQIADGWNAVNRGAESSGAGHTATGCVVWNVVGGGRIASMQHGWGYVIGTAGGITVSTSLGSPSAVGTAPEDWVEGLGEGDFLWPRSLYQRQLSLRLAVP